MSIIKELKYDKISCSELEMTLSNAESNLMIDILNKIIELSKTDSHVIISGEPGTGKEWVARLICQLTESSGNDFGYLSCDQLKLTDLDSVSENNGKNTSGFFGKNRSLTVVVDNYSELNSEEQLQLLASLIKLQESDPRMRFIFTVQKHWETDSANSMVWSYVYDLLNPISIMLPPLREHREDIVPLINLFIRQHLKDERKDTTVKTVEISDQALYKCISYDWPGNVRQLKNAITHAYYSTKGDVIQPEDLPISIEMSSFYTCPVENNRSWSFINAKRGLQNKTLMREKDGELIFEFKNILKRIILKNR